MGPGDGRFRALAVGVALAATAVLFVNVCAAVYDCGCLALWRGGAATCNIHHLAGPHCPWCEHPLLGGGVAFVGTLAVQLAILLAPGPISLVWRFLLALAAFPAVSGAIGWFTGVLFGYWSAS